jgi:CIC family chloride channel protein
MWPASPLTHPVGGGQWRLMIPTAGALLTGWMLSRYFPNARGSGIPQTKAAHVGAGLASALGRSLGLRPERVRELIPVGASAALAAAFNAPVQPRE